MSQEYDKIIKENIEAIFIPLAEKFLGIKIIHSEKISVKLQTTIERESDSVRKVITDQNKALILHLEFQTSDDVEMIYRMAEYRAILQRDL